MEALLTELIGLQRVQSTVDLAALSTMLAKGGTRTSYDLERDDSQGAPILARLRRHQRTV